jgi:3-oxoacyl-[acyl-carrier protein] reductase
VAAPASTLGPARPSRTAARVGADSVLGRMLEPADVGAAVAIALDPALLPATGTTVRLDGGWSVLVGGPRA